MAVAIKSARLLAPAIVAIYGIAVLLVMVRAGSPGEPWWWILAAVFLAWAVAPIAVATLIVRRQTNAIVAILGILVLGFAAASGIYIYLTDMFGQGARSTSALIFIFLPIYQWAFLLTLLVLGSIGSLARRTFND